jgi:DNA-binding FrmR family transcriptional regulator
MDAKLVTRLKKLNGQVQALVRMLEEEQDCDKVIVQFQAAKAALENAFSLMLHNSLHECMRSGDEQSAERILKLISKR